VDANPETGQRSHMVFCFRPAPQHRLVLPTTTAAAAAAAAAAASAASAAGGGGGRRGPYYPLDPAGGPAGCGGGGCGSGGGSGGIGGSGGGEGPAATRRKKSLPKLDVLAPMDRPPPLELTPMRAWALLAPDAAANAQATIANGGDGGDGVVAGGIVTSPPPDQDFMPDDEAGEFW